MVSLEGFNKKKWDNHQDIMGYWDRMRISCFFDFHRTFVSWYQPLLIIGCFFMRQLWTSSAPQWGLKLNVVRCMETWICLLETSSQRTMKRDSR
jgi:hypothetical protein